MSSSFKPVLSGLFLSSALSAIVSLPVFADDAAKDANVLPPVVVSATRVPTSAAEVGSSVTVITAREIQEQQQRTLPEILQQVPGITINQTGAAGGLAVVFMRGTNTNHTKVLIDGVDVTDPTAADGSFDFSQILPSDIEQIEVLRGPQSGLYGSDAIGGVINIITKKGSGPTHYTGTIEGGSFATFNQSAGMRGALERFNYNVDVAHYHSGSTQVTPTNLVPAGRGMNDDSYDNKTVSTKFGAKLTDQLDAGLVMRYVDSTLGFTSDDAQGPQNLASQSDQRELFTRGTVHWALADGKFDQTLGLGYTDYRRHNEDPNSTTPITRYEGNRVKTDWQGNIKLMKGETLTLGAEHQYDEVTSLPDAHIANNAGSVQLQSSYGERWFNAVNIRRDDNDRFGGKTTYRIAPAFLITETNTKLKASAGTGYKAPTLDELFHNYPEFGFTANSALKPETSVGYDAGFEQSLLSKRVEFGSTYFHNKIKNLININDSYTSYSNVGRATTYGYENFMAYKPIKTLTLRGEYTFTIAQDDIADKELLRRPRNKASLSSTWQANDKLLLTATVLYTGSRVDINRAGTVQHLTPGGYGLLNLSGTYEIIEGLKAFGRINNALDKSYQNPVGFDSPGLAIYGGLSFSFDAPSAAVEHK